MKKIVSLLLVFAMLILQIPTVFAGGATVYSYTIKGTNITLTYCFDDVKDIHILDCNDDAKGNLVIPDYISKYTVKAIEDYAFDDCTQLTSIKAPRYASYIGEGAFYNCSGMKSLSLGSVWSIPMYMCEGCTSLQSITIPKTPTEIANGAFMDCESLTEVVLHDKVGTIGGLAFAGCTSLAGIDLKNVTNIGGHAFAGCESLAGITLPSKLTALGGGAFAGCTKLREMTIPAGIKSIEKELFADCISLRSVTLPDGITTIGQDAFYNCLSLDYIRIPDAVTTIGKYAFENCGLKWIEIPAKISFIDEYAVGYTYDEESEVHTPIQDFEILCFERTPAVRYAKNNGIKFTPITQRFFKDDNHKNSWTWAGEHVYKVRNAGIMVGNADGTFGADDPVTRCQMVLMLYNMEGKPAVSGNNPFTDLKESWYRDAVIWAAENNITAGTSPTTFSPNEKLTREQFATFIYRYLKKTDRLEEGESDFSRFVDADKISSFAVEAMKYCVAAGIINGTSETTISPKEIATRAQAAVIFSKAFKIETAPEEKTEIGDVGTTFTFGKYEQDRNDKNGIEDIEWIVLDKDDEKALVISKYALTRYKYNYTPQDDFSWGKSAVKKNLDSIFEDEAFTAAEQDRILNVEIDGIDSRLFLLSQEEAEKYFADYEARVCLATPYASRLGGYDMIYASYKPCYWWLRTPGTVDKKIMDVNPQGLIITTGGPQDADSVLLRPAMWISLD